jgi:NAD(P)-dependent dehydrogenase (short-subunit alcohol dehydrogenase family)
VVFNNAGVGGVMGPAWETSLEDWRWTIDVNLWGVVHGIRSFVPILLEQGGEGHVVSTASMAGLTSNPFMSIYNATKHAVVTLSETLYHDLRMLGSSIGVSVLCPGYVRTRIMDSARNRPGEPAGDPPKEWAGEGGLAVVRALREGVDSGYDPADVALQVFEAIRDERFYVLPAQDEIKQALRQRLDEIGAERNPAPPGAVIGG